jgi:lysophospholipase L1-like esterase
MPFMPSTRLWVIGDSISIDYGPHLQAALGDSILYDRKGGAGARLADPLHATSANGGDSAMVLAYLRERRGLDPIRADLLLINCGLHDIKRTPAGSALQVPADQYRENLRAIVEEARATGARMAWVRTTPLIDEVHNARQKAFHRFSSDLDAYNRIADEVMRQCAVPLIDLHGFTLTCGPALYRDHVHFTPAVQREQGAYLAGWVRGWLAGRGGDIG